MTYIFLGIFRKSHKVLRKNLLFFQTFAPKTTGGGGRISSLIPSPIPVIIGLSQARLKQNLLKRSGFFHGSCLQFSSLIEGFFAFYLAPNLSCSLKLQLHDAIYRLRFYSNSLIHILSLSNSHNNVASIQKNRDDKSDRVIVALVRLWLNDNVMFYKTLFVSMSVKQNLFVSVFVHKCLMMLNDVEYTRFKRFVTQMSNYFFVISFQLMFL